MQENTITHLPDPSGFTSDPFTDVIRGGARKLIEQAIHAELAALLAVFSKEKLEDGRARLVRHGHLPGREMLTGIGPVRVKVPRARDRKPGEYKITFTPSILPRYLLPMNQHQPGLIPDQQFSTHFPSNLTFSHHTTRLPPLFSVSELSCAMVRLPQEGPF